MILYSQKIIAFVNDAKSVLKEILENEMSLKVSRDRFFFEGSTYPIHIVIYERKNVLGFFNPQFYEIGLNQLLMNANLETLKNILRHEIAHYLTHLRFGSYSASHGPEFNNLCRGYGWGTEVSKSNICLEKISSHEIDKGILRKVEKLMALSASSHQNEAEMAILKTQELLLKHNLDGSSLEPTSFVLVRICEQKRKTSKMEAIARILETFFVSIVYHKVPQGIFLEILGEKENVEVAQYVATVLETELETLWDKTPLLIGKRAKNSFFFGIAKGYCERIERQKTQLTKESTTALVVCEGKLLCARKMAYQRLSTKRSSSSFLSEATFLGQKAGHGLNIAPALRGSKSNDLKLLS